MSGEERGRTSYIDLLISTLMEHEKNLDTLLEKLEKIVKDLSTAREASNTDSEISNTLIYMKIKVDRPIDDILKIIESLKE